MALAGSLKKSGYGTYLEGLLESGTSINFQVETSTTTEDLPLAPRIPV
jgi:hypothetical protein